MIISTPGLEAMAKLMWDREDDDEISDQDFTAFAEMAVNVLKMVRLSYAISLKTGNTAFDILIKDVEELVAAVVGELGIDAPEG